MRVDISSQQGVLFNANQQVKKAQNTEDKLEIKEEIQASNEETHSIDRKNQEVLGFQDNLANFAKSDLKISDDKVKSELSKIEDNLKSSMKKSETFDFSKLDKDFLVQNKESFTNAIKVSQNQIQLASLLA